MIKVTILIYNLILVVCLFVCFALVSAQEGSTPCVWDGINGTCVSPRVCLTILDTRSPKPPECAQVPGQPKAEEPLICCTDCVLVNDTRNFVMSASGGVFWKDGRKARDQCLQYLNDLPHECHQDGFYGGITRRLHPDRQCHVHSYWGVGGAPPPNSEPARENPYEALMGFGKDLESAVWLTAGAIISDKFILTSAHGHQTTEGRIPLKFAALGVKNRKSDKSEWQIRKVKKIYHYPEYAKDDTQITHYDDIALLELETAIKFNKDVLPACLPDHDELFDVPTAKYSSWKEATSNFSDFTDTANIMQVKEVNAKECDSKIREGESPASFYRFILPNGINETTQLCYGDSTTCLNVIGAPVVVTTYISRCMNTVVGVNAFGDRCGPGVFTRVSQYVPWIESIVWP